ncbi:MAG: hypothetical protein JWM88_434 [Verrucomicrobia bacterium]|nr:hypothetical protein [Verrucomicrobiota bacterium]
MGYGVCAGICSSGALSAGAGHHHRFISIAHIVCAGIGLIVGVRCLLARKWLGGIAVLCCGFFLLVQAYWFNEWIT